jgi:hypothetical protein
MLEHAAGSGSLAVWTVVATAAAHPAVRWRARGSVLIGQRTTKAIEITKAPKMSVMRNPTTAMGMSLPTPVLCPFSSPHRRV